MSNKENSYKLKQEVFLDQCCLHLAKWSIKLKLFFFKTLIHRLESFQAL